MTFNLHIIRPISSESFNDLLSKECDVVAISPNGRMVTFRSDKSFDEAVNEATKIVSRLGGRVTAVTE